MEKTMIDLRGRSFLTLKDFSEEEIQYLIKLASELKDMKKTGKPHRYLEGQNIALLFEKPSVRTRIASTVACVDLGEIGRASCRERRDIQRGDIAWSNR